MFAFVVSTNSTVVESPARLFKNPVPVTVMVDPPAAEPVAGPKAVVTLVIDGTTGLYVYCDEELEALVPFGVVTTTLYVVTVVATGTVKVSVVDDVTFTLVAFNTRFCDAVVPTKLTEVAPVTNPVPSTSRVPKPVVGPLVSAVCPVGLNKPDTVGLETPISELLMVIPAPHVPPFVGGVHAAPPTLGVPEE